MDPLSTLSLACGIVQVVDFSTKVVKACRQLYKDGSLSENDNIEEMAGHLASLQSSLDVPSQQVSADLLDLSRKCSVTANELIEELQDLRVKQPDKKLYLIMSTLKTLRKKSTIEKIWKRLCDYKNALDSHILIDLRCATIPVDAYLPDHVGLYSLTSKLLTCSSLNCLISGL